MRVHDTVALLLSSVTSAYLATESATVAGTVAIATIFLSITEGCDGSLCRGHCRCVAAGTTEDRS